MSTFIAPLVAMALNDIPVRKVHVPHNVTNNSESAMPAIPMILQFSSNQITTSVTIIKKLFILPPSEKNTRSKDFFEI